MQRSDLEDFFDKNLRMHRGILKNMSEASGARHDAVDVIRTALWYAYVELHLHAATSYKLEKLLEPEAFGKNQYGDRYHRNKWGGYRVGRHKPSARLIERVEERAPGSALLISHLVWDVIRKRKKLEWFEKIGLKQLSNDIRSILFKTNRYGLNEKLIPKLSRRCIRQLERKAGLDALAAQVVFLWIADNQNDRAQALAIGESIYRVLLILSTSPPFSAMRIEVLSLFNAYVFPMAHDGSKGIMVDNLELFSRSSDLLQMVYLGLEDRGAIDGSRKKSMKTKYEILHGEWDPVVASAISPPIGLVVSGSMASTKCKERIAAENYTRRQAWDRLETG
jgi:hypothetical protein